MSLAEDLSRLDELHRQGGLSDEEFAQAKAKVLSRGEAPARHDAVVVQALNGLRRSRGDRWLGGVCGGVAQMTGVAAWIWRVSFALLALCAGSGVLVYLLLWIFVPEEPVVTMTPRQLGS